MNDKKKICPFVCVFIEPIIPMKADDDNKGNVANR